jgi:FtsP/CotA-like multicopper oxidase with cupredoxin domain
VFVVNGKAQPYIGVERRQYCLRLMNGANARYFRVAMSNGAPFLVIGTDTWLLPYAIQQASIPLAMSQRADDIVDFRDAPSEVFLLNVQEQDSPKKPGSIRRPGVPLDAALRPADVVVTRKFVFERRGGAWLINDREFDPDRDDAIPRLGQVERWNLENKGGGWTHSIHVHLEAMQIQQVNGKAPTGIQAFKRDSVDLGPNGNASILIRFRTFLGRSCSTATNSSTRACG